MFSTFSDPLLSSSLQDGWKNSKTVSAAVEKPSKMEDQLNFNGVEIFEDFLNLPSPTLVEHCSLFDDTFPEVEEQLVNFNMELENVVSSGIKCDVLLSDAMLNRQISCDNYIQIKPDAKRIEENIPMKKSSENNNHVRFVDEKLDSNNEDSQSSGDGDDQLEILRQTAHDYEKRIDANNATSTNKFTIQKFDASQRRKFREYYGGGDIKPNLDFNSIVAREVTIDAGKRVVSMTTGASRPEMAPSPSGKSRGAVYAKMYREKSKTQVQQMQHDLDQLTEENKDLKHTVNEMSGQLVSLNQEIRYLRSVLANQSQLSVLLKNVTANTPGLKFRFPFDNNDEKKIDSEKYPIQTTTTTMVTRKRKNAADDSAAAPGVPRKSAKTDFVGGAAPGVCLHVNGDSISLEFCARCAQDARCDN